MDQSPNEYGLSAELQEHEHKLRRLAAEARGIQTLCSTRGIGAEGSAADILTERLIDAYRTRIAAMAIVIHNLSKGEG